MCITVVKGDRPALKLVVQPKAKKTRIVGLHGDMVKLAVASPPVDGKANREVISFLCGLFDLKKHHVAIIAGEKSRKKLCLLGDLDEAAIRRRLAPFIE
ncbi:MAG TPA: DUF167 domain-containing protein [Desulfopila sp.]|nr:DUF167 domain-containing protein [Desulfopila sp.]